MRLTSITRRQTSGVSSHSFPFPPVMPALLTRMSILPCFSTTDRAARSTEPSSVSSTCSVVTFPRSESAALAVSRALLSMSHRETSAPEVSIRSAVAYPMPRAPPVTMATRPLRSSWFIAVSSLEAIRLLSGHGCLALLTEAGDAQTHDLTWLQVEGRLLTKPHARRCAGRDHVARLKAHELADVADQKPGEALRKERSARDVGNDARQVAHASACIQHARTLAPGVTVA